MGVGAGDRRLSATASSRDGWFSRGYGLLLAVAVLDRLPLPGGISAYRAVSLPLLVVILLSLRGRRLRGLRRDSVGFALLLFLVLAGGSAFFARRPEVAFLHLLRLGQYALWAALLAVALGTCRSRGTRATLHRWLALSAWLASLTVLSDFWGLTSFYRWFQTEAPWVRQMGILGEANYAGSKLAVLFPFLWAQLARCARSRRWTGCALWLGANATVGLALFITGSRLGGLLTVGGLLVVLWKERRAVWRLRVWLVVGLVVLALALAGTLTTGSFLQRAFRYLGNRYVLLVTFLSEGSEQYRGIRETSLAERRAMLQASLRMFQEHPWTGVGLAHFPLEVGRYVPGADGFYAHNTYAAVLAETGLLGALVFVTLCVSTLAALLRQARVGGQEGFYSALSCGLLLVGLAFLHELDNKYFWTLFLPLALRPSVP